MKISLYIKLGHLSIYDSLKYLLFCALLVQTGNRSVSIISNKLPLRVLLQS